MSLSINRTKDYADRVLAGEYIAGANVRASCKRFLSDLENDRGLVFDEEAAARAWETTPGLRCGIPGNLSGTNTSPSSKLGG